MKIDRLYGRSWIGEDLTSGDVIPVGGTMFSNDFTTHLVADTAAFQSVAENAQAIRDTVPLDKLQPWLDGTPGGGVDAELYAAVLAVQGALKPIREKQTNFLARAGLYNAKDVNPRLSEVVDAGAAACVEYGCIAQHALQQLGVKSHMMTGEVAGVGDEYGEAHTFLVIEHKGKAYIYDPTQLTSSSQGNFPSVFRAPDDFLTQIRADKATMLPMQNVLTGASMEYGTNDGVNIVRTAPTRNQGQTR